MEWLSTHLANGLVILGILALIIEVALLGFSSIVLFFAGLSLCASGGLMMLGLLPETMTTALWSNTLFTAVLALLLWKPFKRLQDDRDPGTLQSDFARDVFVLEQDVYLDGTARRKYSGVEWQLKSETPLAAGTRVTVSRTDVGVMWVTPVD